MDENTSAAIGDNVMVIYTGKDIPKQAVKITMDKEIKSVFQKEIMDQNGKLFTGTILRNFEMSLRTGDADLFTNTLQNYLMQSASCLHEIIL